MKFVFNSYKTSKCMLLFFTVRIGVAPGYSCVMVRQCVTVQHEEEMMFYTDAFLWRSGLRDGRLCRHRVFWWFPLRYFIIVTHAL